MIFDRMDNCFLESVLSAVRFKPQFVLGFTSSMSPTGNCSRSEWDKLDAFHLDQNYSFMMYDLALEHFLHKLRVSLVLHDIILPGAMTLARISVYADKVSTMYLAMLRLKLAKKSDCMQR